ncbi:MAG: cytochrome c3 family protein [Terriglobales bacterium]
MLLLGAAAMAQRSSASAPEVKPAHATTQSPHGNLSMNCEACHTAISWSPIRALPEFSHDKTRYPLRGMHQGVTCHQCHTRMVFTNIAKTCSECHADIHRGQFGARCQECHTVNGWQVSVKEIKQHINRFPLVGAHAAVECASCHKGAASGQFAGLSTDCFSCHSSDFQTAVFDHRAAGLPPACVACHSVDTWLGAKFDHGRFTGFALTGMHASLDCMACHTSGRYVKASADCFSCHAREFDSTANPNHVQAQFPHDCGLCHSTATWQGATFDHASVGFPLTGAHATLQCVQCHSSGYTRTSTDCASCHLNDYNGTTNPNHKLSNFPTNCAICHTTTAWQPASFDHSKTRFPLTGAHTTVQCAQCHAGGRYTGTPTNCDACHLNEYNSTTNPNHKAAGFPTDCSICHSTTSWAGATFDHTKTGFPLTGAHATLQCAACHTSGYTGTSAQCVSCHLNDYNRTTNPNHQSAGLPTDCAVCHTTTTWSGATFDHAKTGFALTGAHVKVSCVSCHVGGRYAGTPTDCYSCHKTEYTGTTNPNHVAAQFPTNCAVCHSTAGWQGATFNHTWFPIYTGKHAGKWTTCGDCHVNPSNYAVFSCITCHQHDAANVVPEHRDVRNFVYSATSCYSCHPAGQGD